MAGVMGYCVKCKAKREMVNGSVVKMKNGRPAYKGKCKKCGTGMYKIMSADEAKKSPSKKSVTKKLKP